MPSRINRKVNIESQPEYRIKGRDCIHCLKKPSAASLRAGTKLFPHAIAAETRSK